jgi:phage gp46-like protein
MMGDAALVWDPDSLAADLAIEANDLVRDEGLRTAVLLSLFLDRQAEPGDVLPPGETDRRGWWADAVPVVEGDQIGSRLWLLAREKDTSTVRARAEEYAREALAWLVEDKVADRVEVVAEAPRPGALNLVIDIYRPKAEPTRYHFADVWSAMET